MRKSIFLLPVTLILASGLVHGQPGIDSVYLTADSGLYVIGDVIYMHPLGGGDVKIAVNCYNGQNLAALSYPFVETCGAAHLDSLKNDRAAPPICMLGGRINVLGWGAQVLNIDLWPCCREFLLGGVAVTAPSLPPGEGYIAKMTFTMPSGSPDTCICIDTVMFPVAMMQHVDEWAVGYTPKFTAKCFPILRGLIQPPILTCPPTISGYTEASVSWQVSATHPEGHAINPAANVFFRGASCGSLAIAGSNPWTVDFNTAGCAAGDYEVCVEVFDEFGLADTCCTMVTPESFFAVATVGSVDCAFPGQVVEVPVNIFSGVDIGGFKLYIEYDPTVMTKLGVERGDLIDDFDGYYDDYGHVPRYHFQYFNERQLPCVQQCETYKIKIVGIADMPDGVVNGPLEAGEGNLFNLKFQVAKNTNLHDLFLPVKFEFDYDFDLKAPSFSSATGESLYVDVNWPGELTGPNYGIFKIVTFVDGGVLVCSDAFCWTGDINMNEYPYEIADAVMFANYFLFGLGVFDIDPDIQIQATDVNQDGFTLSMSDFVFLIRIILEDISPKHKLSPSSDLAAVNVVTQGDAVKVSSNSSTAIGAGLYVFRHSGDVKNLTLHADMNMKYSDANGELRVLVYNFDGKSIPAGVTDLFSFEAKEVELVEVNAADFYGSALKSTITTKVLPTKFALMNNYPNPFNLATSISFALPVDSKVSLKLYNIAGQLVNAYEGAYEAGSHTITWDGTNTKGETVASGIYFYKLVAGDYTCTKKMVLTK